jgi:hypothetical protein
MLGHLLALVTQRGAQRRRSRRGYANGPTESFCRRFEAERFDGG